MLWIAWISEKWCSHCNSRPGKPGLLESAAKDGLLMHSSRYTFEQGSQPPENISNGSKVFLKNSWKKPVHN